jgi:hypothetical protein
MKLLERMQAIGQAAVDKAIEHAPGVASKAIALGQAAVSATASVASSAYEATRDFAADKLKGSHFSDTDVEQAAGILKMMKVGVANPDGTFRLLTDDECTDIAKMALVATLEDDDA